MAAPASSQQAAAQNDTAKTGGRKRHVASAAGAARYHKPIGSEIGQARDANHAAIQQDQGARKNYGDLVGGDQAKQRQALDGMSVDDLNKLADIAFSFKSADPKVVQLRIAARNAQARRGIRVPVGQTQTYLKGKAPAPAPGNRNNRGTAKALSRVGPASTKLIELAQAAEQKNVSKLGNFPIPDIAHLRKAVQAIGRAKPEHRPIIARHILARAKALNASHLVSDHIKHYALGHRQPGTVGMSRAELRAIELAGRWKHGWIPLDAVAHTSKMKGGKGRPWWEGSGHSGGGAEKALHGSPKSGSPGTSGKLTNVVKSGSADSEPRGAKMDQTAYRNAALKINAQHDDAVREARRKGTQPPKFPHDKVDALRAQISGSPHKKGDSVSAKVPDRLAPVSATVEGHSDTGKVRVSYYAGDGTGNMAAKQTVDVHHSKVTPRSPRPGSATGANKVDAPTRQRETDTTHSGQLVQQGYLPPEQRSNPDYKPSGPTDAAKAKSEALHLENGSKYIQMHGTDGARQKVAQMEARPRLSSLERKQLEGLKAALAGKAGGQSPKTKGRAAAKVPTTSGVSAVLRKGGFGKSTAYKASTNHRGQQVGSGGRTAGVEITKGIGPGEVEVRLNSAHRSSSRGPSAATEKRQAEERARLEKQLTDAGYSFEYHKTAGYYTVKGT